MMKLKTTVILETIGFASSFSDALPDPGGRPLARLHLAIPISARQCKSLPAKVYKPIEVPYETRTRSHGASHGLRTEPTGCLHSHRYLKNIPLENPRAPRARTTRARGQRLFDCVSGMWCCPLGHGIEDRGASHVQVKELDYSPGSRWASEDLFACRADRPARARGMARSSSSTRAPRRWTPRSRSRSRITVKAMPRARA